MFKRYLKDQHFVHIVHLFLSYGSQNKREFFLYHVVFVAEMQYVFFKVETEFSRPQ
jgi:hypothetical protein